MYAYQKPPTTLPKKEIYSLPAGRPLTPPRNKTNTWRSSPPPVPGSTYQPYLIIHPSQPHGNLTATVNHPKQGNHLPKGPKPTRRPPKTKKSNPFVEYPSPSPSEPQQPVKKNGKTKKNPKRTILSSSSSPGHGPHSWIHLDNGVSSKPGSQS